ncbi:7777_t:CDS:2, partial [Gigaspora margarita]
MYWLVQHDIATNTITDLCNLINQPIQNAEELHIPSNVNILKNPSSLQAIELSRNDYGSYNNNHARKDFIDAIGKVIEEEVCHEIRKSSVWSLMIDESNTVIKEKTLAILNKFFDDKNLSVLLLGHLVMMAHQLCHLNSIATLLKRQNPFLTEHHCISHHLALACKDAAEAVPYMHSYNKIVGNLYTYF